MELTFKERLQTEEFAKKLCDYHFRDYLYYELKLSKGCLPIFVDETDKPSIIDISEYGNFDFVKDYTAEMNKIERFTIIPNSNLKIKWRIGKKRESIKILNNYVVNKDMFYEYISGKGFWVDSKGYLKNEVKKKKEVLWYAIDDKCKTIYPTSHPSDCGMGWYAILIGELERVDEK